MSDVRFAVIGIGATGAVLAAALLKKHPDTILVDPASGMEAALRKRGISISGELSYSVPVTYFHSKIEEIGKYNPDIIFICAKTFHLEQILDELKKIYRTGMKIIGTQNGLGPEDLIASKFGKEASFRMSLNYGVSLIEPGKVKTAFFNPPNHIGALAEKGRVDAEMVADLLTQGGLNTVSVDDIKLYVWKKMIMKCTMASICAVTDRTIQEALSFPPTREIAIGCFKEVLSVASAMGYDLGEQYLEDALAYLEKVGIHKDSMCADIANKTHTEIDFLGGKVVQYAHEKGISIPFYLTMTNLVKSLENSYLTKGGPSA